MAEIPNREILESDFAKRFGKLARRQQREIKRLFGDPPAFENIPEEFWDKMQRETDSELYAILLLIFDESAIYHGWDTPESGLAAYGWAKQRADEVSRYWVESTQTRIQRGLAKLQTKQEQLDETTIERAREFNRTSQSGSQVASEPPKPGPVGEQNRFNPVNRVFPSQEQTVVPTKEELAEILDDAFGAKRVETTAMDETTRARHAGGESAVEETVGISQDDEWQNNPQDSVSGPCKICVPLNNLKRSEWPWRYREGPPSPHRRCCCSVRYKFVSLPDAIGRMLDDPDYKSMKAFEEAKHPRRSNGEFGNGNSIREGKRTSGVTLGRKHKDYEGQWTDKAGGAHRIESSVIHGKNGDIESVSVAVGDIAHVHFIPRDGHLYAGWVEVNPKYRRRGIASEMYKLAEEESGMAIVSSGSQSESGRRFAQSRKSMNSYDPGEARGSDGKWTAESARSQLHKQAADMGTHLTPSASHVVISHPETRTVRSGLWGAVSSAGDGSERDEYSIKPDPEESSARNLYWTHYSNGHKAEPQMVDSFDSVDDAKVALKEEMEKSVRERTEIHPLSSHEKRTGNLEQWQRKPTKFGKEFEPAGEHHHDEDGEYIGPNYGGMTLDDLHDHSRKSMPRFHLKSWFRQIPNAAEWRAYARENAIEIDDRSEYKSFDESKHPRGDHGRWSSGESMHADHMEHQQQLRKAIESTDGYSKFRGHIDDFQNAKGSAAKKEVYQRAKQQLTAHYSKIAAKVIADNPRLNLRPNAVANLGTRMANQLADDVKERDIEADTHSPQAIVHAFDHNAADALGRNAAKHDSPEMRALEMSFLGSARDPDHRRIQALPLHEMTPDEKRAYFDGSDALSNGPRKPILTK